MPYKFNVFTGNFDIAGSGGGGGSGDVVGPASSTDNAFARWDGTTGKLLQDSTAATLDDSGNASFNSMTLTTDLTVANGGTGASTLTDGGILLGSGTSAITATGQPTNGQLLIGSTGVDPVLASLTAPAAGITITGGAGSITFALADDLAGVEAITGNGVVTRTASNTYATNTIPDRAIVAGDSGNTLQGIGPLTDGQLVIGATGADPAAATITAGSGINVTNGTNSITIAATGGGLSPREYWFDAASLQPLETNTAPLEMLSGTNKIIFARAMDDTTEEYCNGKIYVPGSLDTSGDITLNYYVFAKTAASSRNVGMTFGYSWIADGEDWDGAGYTDLDTGATSVNATQDNLTRITDTVTVSTAGAAANDIGFIRISRDPSVASDLVGDLYFLGVNIAIDQA